VVTGLSSKRRLRLLWWLRFVELLITPLDRIIGVTRKPLAWVASGFGWIRYLNPNRWLSHLQAYRARLHESLIVRRSDGQIEGSEKLPWPASLTAATAAASAECLAFSGQTLPQGWSEVVPLPGSAADPQIHELQLRRVTKELSTLLPDLQRQARGGVLSDVKRKKTRKKARK
jgi:hypothetical protein